MKISKSRIISYVIAAALISLDFFYLSPFVKEKYFQDDIFNFTQTSWKYSFLLAALYLIFFILYGIIKRIITIKYLVSSLIVVFLIAVLTKKLNDDLFLVINSKIFNRETYKVYEIIRNDPNKVLFIYDKIDGAIDVEHTLVIDSIRTDKKLKPVYILSQNDTIVVKYKIGVFDVKYLK